MVGRARRFSRRVALKTALAVSAATALVGTAVSWVVTACSSSGAGGVHPFGYGYGCDAGYGYGKGYGGYGCYGYGYGAGYVLRRLLQPLIRRT